MYFVIGYAKMKKFTKLFKPVPIRESVLSHKNRGRKSRETVPLKICHNLTGTGTKGNETLRKYIEHPQLQLVTKYGTFYFINPDRFDK